MLRGKPDAIVGELDKRAGGWAGAPASRPFIRLSEGEDLLGALGVVVDNSRSSLTHLSGSVRKKPSSMIPVRMPNRSMSWDRPVTRSYWWSRDGWQRLTRGWCSVQLDGSVWAVSPTSTGRATPSTLNTERIHRRMQQSDVVGETGGRAVRGWSPALGHRVAMSSRNARAAGRQRANEVLAPRSGPGSDSNRPRLVRWRTSRLAAARRRMRVA